MTMHQPISPELAEAHRLATDDVNRWRGHCMESFARIEQAVGRALAAIAADGRAPEIKQPAMFGARVASLTQAFALPLFLADARKASATLKGLEAHLARRNVIVHGAGKVWVDRNSEWLWTYAFVPSKRDASPETGQIERQEAKAMERALASEGQSLSDTLVNFAAEIARSKAQPA